MKTAEHARAALARDLDSLFTEDAADEVADAAILRVEPMRTDVEMKVAVVECPGEASHDWVLLDDGHLKALPNELICNREPGHTGSNDGH